MYQESGLRAFPVPRSQSPETSDTQIPVPGSQDPNPQKPRSWFPSPSRISRIPVLRYPDSTPDPNPRIQVPRMPRSLSVRLGSRISDPRSSYFRNSHPEGGRRQGPPLTYPRPPVSYFDLSPDFKRPCKIRRKIWRFTDASYGPQVAL